MLPRSLLALLLLAVLLGPATALGGRPARLSGPALEAAKSDWQKVQAGQLEARAFMRRHGISNGAMTRLRLAYPEAFGKLDRTRDFSSAELGTMQRDWKRIASGEITLTEFKAEHGLSTDTYGRLMAEHGHLFPAIEIKRGGKRLAEQRRAERLDLKRVRALGRYWKTEVLEGELTVDEFYAKHETSKREITEIRKQPGLAALFPSATGIESTRGKQTLDVSERSRLGALWRDEVVPGRLSIDEFRRTNALSQRALGELRQDQVAFPEPERAKHAGGPSRRTFTPAEIAELKADWQKVLAFELERGEFMRKHTLHPEMMKRLRDGHPGAFPSFSGRAKQVRLTPKALDALKADWLLVVAERLGYDAFLDKHGISGALLQRLRSDPAHAADFATTKGRSSPRAEVALASAAVVQDWAGVRKRELSAAEFRRRHPSVRAADLVALQKNARSASRSSLAALADELGVAGPEIPEAKLTRLRAEWGRVLNRDVSQRVLLAELEIPDQHFARYRAAHPDEFPRPGPKPKPEPKPRAASKFAGEGAYSEAQLAQARDLFARHQLGELELARDVVPRLKEIGISKSQGIPYLRKLDPVAFATRKDFVERRWPAIVEDVIRLARAHRHVIKKWSDLVEVVTGDEAFRARHGAVNLSQESAWVRRERAQNGRLYQALAEIGLPIGQGRGPARGTPAARSSKRPERPAVAAGAVEDEAPPPDEEPGSRRVSARTLARALDGLEPTPTNLERVVQKLGKDDPNFGTRRKWLSLRSQFEGVYPELARWNFDSHRPYSLRYVARWTEAAHQAGPGASYEQIAAIFRKSPEYLEDRRLPPKASGTVMMAKSYPELVSSWAVRRTFQTTRRLLELLRTAPQGKSVYQLDAAIRSLGLSGGYRYAQKCLQALTPAEAERHGMSAKTFAKLKAGRFAGLGQATNPAFDPNAEPPGVSVELAREILDTPTLPPLLRFALTRLDGDLPFRSQNVMFINHRYSDIVSLVDSMAAAGMARENAVFVSTPYPFKDSVTYQLQHRGLQVLVPKQNMRSYEQTVEKGIRRMLEIYDQQVKSLGKGKPILIIDDGGMAAKMIGKKFREHIGKFRIVEITAAGYRLAREFERQHKRLPWVYYSIAYTEAKKQITSEFFGRRVARRTMSLLPQTGVRLANKEATILGAGPMGYYAALELEAQGYHVTFVEPSAKVAAALPSRFKVLPIEQALPGRSLILGMSGYLSLKAEQMGLVDDGAVVVQGSSKRQEFQMGLMEKQAKKTLLPRTDGLAQKSYTYHFKRGPAAGRRVHFLGDGWTINHDGSLHGTPMQDIQLELALIFESAVRAARTHLQDTGVYRELGPGVQQMYIGMWRGLVGK